MLESEKFIPKKQVVCDESVFCLFDLLESQLGSITKKIKDLITPILFSFKFKMRRAVPTSISNFFDF